MILVFLALDEDVEEVIPIVDLGLSAIFLLDFSYRFLTAESKRRYLLRGGGWLDFIGSLPFPGVRVARLFRVARASRVLRHFGARGAVDAFLERKSSGTLLVVVFLVVLVLEFASIGVLAAEKGDPEANIKTGGDALWWAYVTVTTVGYGDKFPVTAAGRLVGVLTLTVGVGLFGTFTAFVANLFLATRKAKRRKPEADARSRLREIEEALAAQEERSASLRASLGEVRQQL